MLSQKVECCFVGVRSVRRNIQRRVLADHVAAAAIGDVEVECKTGQSAGNLVHASVHRGYSDTGVVRHIRTRYSRSVEANRCHNILRPIEANARTRLIYKLLEPICHMCKVKKHGEPLPPVPTKPKL